jgi:hypothetical protein
MDLANAPGEKIFPGELAKALELIKAGTDIDYVHFIYFSLASLTTVGFGDITPITPPTRLASLALSVLGPLYIAVVLGVLISRFSGGAEPPPWAPQDPGP